jgi:predicted small metal-binding protein
MGLNSPFRSKGDSLEDIASKALEHIRKNHAGDFKDLLSAAQIEEMKKSLARSTRVIAG